MNAPYIVAERWIALTPFALTPFAADPRPRRSPLDTPRLKFHAHRPVVPDHAYRESLDRFGICVCWVCQRRGFSVAWGHDMALIEGNHTKEWQELSWHVGDPWASWMCTWCDIQDEPVGTLAALLTIASLHWSKFKDADVTTRALSMHTRDLLLNFIERS